MNRIKPILQFFQVLLRAILSVGFAQFHFQYHQAAIWQKRDEIAYVIEQADSAENLVSLHQKEEKSFSFFHFPTSLFIAVLQHQSQEIRLRWRRIFQHFSYHIKPGLSQERLTVHCSRLSPSLPCIPMV